MTTIKTALIAGGGIAGPVAAVALQKAGIQATVYEAYATAADDAGATLSIAPNGINALAAIGADAAVRGIGQPIRRMVMADGQGRQLFALDGPAGLPPSRLVWRSELYRALTDYALAHGIQIEYGKRLVAADETSGGISVRFADGGSAGADILIGADGIHSTVRALIDPGAPNPAYDGLLGFAAITPYRAPGETDAMYFVYGKRAFLGYWVQPDGRTAWFSNLPHPFMSRTEVRERPATEWLATLREAYAGDVPAGSLLAHTGPEDLLIFGPTDMLPPVPHWWRGRMVLTGDAAHAPNHSSGQGASLAIESAIELARCLRDLSDVPTAFATYERLRRPRVERIAAEAARTNRRKAAGPVARLLLSVLMPVAMKTVMRPEKLFGSTYGYTIDWAQPVRA